MDASAIARRAEQLRPYQLDRRAARQQPMLRAPHFAHPAAPEQLDELIAAHLLGLAQAAAEPLQHVRRQRRHDRAREVGQVETTNVLPTDATGAP